MRPVRALRAVRRLMDDLWHVVTGYGRDYLGEAALFAFTYAQTRNRGIALIVWVGKHRYKKEGHPEALPIIDDGYRRGRRATYLPAVAWESLLAEPLDAVRSRLGIEPPPAYQPIDS